MSGGTTRRDALRGIATAAALIGVPVSAAASSFGRGDWDRTYARFRKVEATYDRLCNASDQASEGASNAQPRHDVLHDKFGLLFGTDRDVAFRLIYIELAKADPLLSRGWIVAPADKAAAWKVANGLANAEANRLADEWEAYQARHEALWLQYRVKELDNERKRYLDTYTVERDALMQVPAPDHAALLVKLELAMVSLDDDHMDSALADARRLLSHGRA